MMESMHCQRRRTASPVQRTSGSDRAIQKAKIAYTVCNACSKVLGDVNISLLRHFIHIGCICSGGCYCHA